MKSTFNKLIIIVFVLTLQQYVIYAEVPEPQEPTINQEFIEYLNSNTSLIKPDFEGTAKNFGYIPVPYPKNTGILMSSKKDGSLSTPPTSFDLRSSNYTTSAKNQGNCGSCWAFASIGSVESNWLINNYGNYDLSENNMKNCHNFFWSACDGGNSEIASSYLTLKGIVSESDDNYRDYSQSCNSSVNSFAYISNLYYLPNRSNSGYEDILKNIIMEFGGVFSSMTWSGRYYNSNARTYRYTGTAVQNHAILIVGWNDNMTVTVNGRTSTGAWIAKNSWGSSWGDNGYFYIAYDDTRINGETAIWTSREIASSIEKLYYYDEIGAVRQIGFNSNTGYALIKFTSTGNQTISKIGTWINSYNSTISIEVYGSFQNNTLSNLLGSISNLTCDYPGYYTFDLDNPISINSNSDFYIKVQYYTPNYRYPIPIERSIQGYCSPNIEAGKCWISNTGRTWLQTGSNTRYPYDVCIRAYATQSSNNYIEVETYEPQEISSNGAVLGGTVRANRVEVINKGVCWSLSSNPDLTQNRTANGSGTGTFSSGLNNLNQGTTYYFRAYAITANDTIYGEVSSFITLSLPTVADAEISNITSSSAVLSASVIDDGNTNITDRGFYYNSSANIDSRANKLSANSGLGNFSITISNLRPGQTYYVKSFATNSVGTSYGDEISFTTSSVAPTVSTGSSSEITTNSAVISGNVNEDGGASVSERGICYSNNNYPDINSEKITSGSGLGNFSVTLSNLNSGTTYYARAYAINSIGTSYGSVISFTTEEEQREEEEESDEEEAEEILPPSVQDYNIIISDVSYSSLNISWTKGNGAGSFVVIRQNYSIDSNDYPQSNTQYYSFNNDFRQAPSIGNAKIAYYGSGNSLRISGLQNITRYYIRIFAYNGDPADGTAAFNQETATNNPITFRTARFKGVPLDNNEASSFNIENIYPNPANDNFNLNVFSSDGCDILVRLFDINGNIVLNNFISNLDKGNNIITVSTDSLPSGYYKLILSNGQEIVLDSIVITH